MEGIFVMGEEFCYGGNSGMEGVMGNSPMEGR